ncbi:pilus assembly protein [Roseateles depolymerans]|uniref:Pilus tip-associated protein n=1 Tax=Roseateles depolymerans TaxID=76731 RepID=A0A0U3LG66_9BURK|nr:PilC/PilY family type IV pilus protein [Roseateles depolymerans]ALV05474.1 Pilus tip-associated protein [Roseateles depolymerans]REG14509.1 type IV pilus assembly protein PilY1 [Roseateles depolymerans]
MNHIPPLSRRLGGAALATALTAALTTSMLASSLVQAQTKLADQPVLSATSVPGNLALALSVEYPTAVSNTHQDTAYNPATNYIGYFDPNKCYNYVYSDVEADRYFQPAGKATNHLCNNKWSGNFMNWASMQTIDPFRWALTGGARVKDTADTTIIEKAWASGQGGASNFPDRLINANITGATPLAFTQLKLRIQGLGNKMRFTQDGDNNNPKTLAAFNNPATPSTDTVYEVSVRVKVCEPSEAAGGLEANCIKYSGGYKPEGLIQKYSDQVRFSAFGYLNDATVNRDGGVLRARMKFVGPTQPVPGAPATNNSNAEWDAKTGIMAINPDPTDASSTANAYGITISNSGVMNYLNKFGTATSNYKTYDPVGELYYAALRYYRNLGNVPEYSNDNGASKATKEKYADGFPVITDWNDPILYSCQKNFILGIGDVNTHADRNLPGATGNSEPAKPGAVTADTLDTVLWTNRVGTLQGIADLGTKQNYNGCCTNNGALMAGMAYYANTTDIRSDLSGRQTIKTYWLDVQEYQKYVANNQFYLAAKYGGFTAPTGYDPTNIAAKDFQDAWWHTGPATDKVGNQLRPDTYFTAAKADTMVDGLVTAFASIGGSIKAPTSSFQTVDATLKIGEASYGTTYDASTWAGNVWAAGVRDIEVGATIKFDKVSWNFADQLYAQMSATSDGWAQRRIVTINPTTQSGTSFLYNSLTAAQKTAVTPTWSKVATGDTYVKWLRGDQSNEQNAVGTGSLLAYRTRTANRLVGDIGESGVTVLGPPSLEDGSLSDAGNPGYSSHAKTYANRPNIVLAGTNAGMVHVINGTLTGTTAGKELFAFVPNAAITGPSNTPSVDGIAAVGNPDYAHRYLVNGKITVGEVDFNKTSGTSASGNDWRSIAVGGLGKGGRSVWALDLTTADSTSSEANAATRVLWEYTDANMGFVYGKPIITKIKGYGWVVVVGSGLNTPDGKGAFVILNARTGQLLKRVALPTTGVTGTVDDGSTSNPTGLTYINAWHPDSSDLTAETIYGGDLRGNLWRLDVSGGSTNIPAPVKIAKLTDINGKELSVTSAPKIHVDPSTGWRWVSVGTGRLLSTDDINSTDLNRLYMIRDGGNNSYTATSLPTGVSYPILESNVGRHDLVDLSTSGSQLGNTKAGFFIDLKTSLNTTGYRVISDADGYANYVLFAAIQPTTVNGGCSTSATSWAFLIDLASGGVYKEQVNFLATTARIVQFDGEVYATVSGNEDPKDPEKDVTENGDKALGKKLTGGGGTARLINWREIPLRN